MGNNLINANGSSFDNSSVSAATAESTGVVTSDEQSIRVDGEGTLSVASSNPTYFNCTLGDPNANSYVCLEEAVGLLYSLPQSEGIVAWQASGTDAQERSLIGATMTLDALSWLGCKCTCEQRLEWPRRLQTCPCPSDCKSIPYDIRLATSYLAAYLGEDGGFIGIEGSSGSTASVGALSDFERVQIGPIEVEMKQNNTYGDQLSTNIGNIPPFVADLIRSYLKSFGITEGRMGRDSIAKTFGYYVGAATYSGTMYLQNGKVYPRIGGWASRGRC